MFDPNTKVNQHFVPRFWQNRFNDTSGHLHKLERNKVRQAGSKNLMSGDWIYTTYDHLGMPSNHLEDALSRLEAHASVLMAQLDTPQSLPSDEDQIFLGYFIVLSACRHPDVMGHGHRRGKALGYIFADVHSMTKDQFQHTLLEYGIQFEDASSIYEILLPIPQETLLYEAEDIEYRPPNDPTLPAQLSLDPETIERAYLLLGKHRVTILDASEEIKFVLGDTPFPPNLAYGFTIPLSSCLALRWDPADQEMLPAWNRRPALAREVAASNQMQVDNAARVVIGSSKALLERYVSN